MECVNFHNLSMTINVFPCVVSQNNYVAILSTMKLYTKDCVKSNSIDYTSWIVNCLLNWTGRAYKSLTHCLDFHCAWFVSKIYKFLKNKWVNDNQLKNHHNKSILETRRSIINTRFLNRSENSYLFFILASIGNCRLSPSRCSL